jgi:hypothetical protein
MPKVFVSGLTPAIAFIEGSGFRVNTLDLGFKV